MTTVEVQKRVSGNFDMTYNVLRSYSDHVRSLPFNVGSSSREPPKDIIISLTYSAELEGFEGQPAPLGEQPSIVPTPAATGGGC